MILSFVIVGIITITFTVAAPVVSNGCSPIIPEESCRDALSPSGAEDLVRRIISDLDDMRTNDILRMLMNLTDRANEQSGPYKLDNTGDRYCHPTTNASDCIVRSVYRFKCEVPVVADIMKNEFIRELVQEESSYATECKMILNSLRVLLHLKSLISRYQPLNSCTVPEESCRPTFNSAGLDRLVLIRSIAADIFELQADLKVALLTFSEEF